MRRALPLLLVWLWAGAAGAESPGPRVEDAEAWRGRFCTPAGCKGAGGTATGAAAGFAAAVVGAAWWSRRGPGGDR